MLVISNYEDICHVRLLPATVPAPFYRILTLPLVTRSSRQIWKDLSDWGRSLRESHHKRTERGGWTHFGHIAEIHTPAVRKETNPAGMPSALLISALLTELRPTGYYTIKTEEESKKLSIIQLLVQDIFIFIFYSYFKNVWILAILGNSAICGQNCFLFEGSFSSLWLHVGLWSFPGTSSLISHNLMWNTCLALCNVIMNLFRRPVPIIILLLNIPF